MKKAVEAVNPVDIVNVGNMIQRKRTIYKIVERKGLPVHRDLYSGTYNIQEHYNSIELIQPQPIELIRNMEDPVIIVRTESKDIFFLLL